MEHSDTRTIGNVIYKFHELPEGQGGGKATGLGKLVRAGFPVPDGFVITDSALFDQNDLHRAWLGLDAGPVAVRSSAKDEDGCTLSFAGQYSTFLDVRGFDDLLGAIRRCAGSLRGSQAESYRSGMNGDGSSGPDAGLMPVIVQRMVEPAFAGVIFTVDPLSGDRLSVVIEAVRGRGERLVSGEISVTRYHVKRDSLEAELHEMHDVEIEAAMLERIAREGLEAEEHFCYPLDMEWAVDAGGNLFWLQARPVTALAGPDIHEFDYRDADGRYFTRANIGEMMPGAVTPLTTNVFGDAIDYCVRYFYRISGSLTGKTRPRRFVVSFYGHLFFDLNMMFTMVDRVLVSSAESFYRNLLGHELDEGPVYNPAPFAVRLFNSFRFAYFALVCKPSMRRLERLAAAFSIDCDRDDPSALFSEIDDNLRLLNLSYAWHLRVSTHSGVTNGILLEIMKKGGCDPDRLDGYLAALLSDIKGIESVQPIRDMEAVAAAIAGRPGDAERFVSLPSEEALDWLQSPLSGNAGRLFTAFLERHGHRCIREAEFREKDWGEDPATVVATIGRLVGNPRQRHTSQLEKTKTEILSRYPAIRPGAFNWALNGARSGVWGREHTKSLVIRVQSRFKHAYRRIAELLVMRGTLPDEDLIFFFTHTEIGRLIVTGDAAMVRHAMKRRRLIFSQAGFRFPDVFKGRPVPLEKSEDLIERGSMFSGTPVSPGIVRGPVRMIRSRDDAERLLPGEIMVADFTDIGWTPYYGTAAGLVTEVGCSLSHGAVVAREYGLPMVTAIPGLMSGLSTGDIVEIDGRKGTVVLISRADADNQK